MSLAFDKLKVEPVVASALDLGREEKYPASIGGTQITFKQVISTSYSNSQASFTANPPDPQSVIDRHVKISQPVRVRFRAVPAAGTRVFQSGYAAFRAMPLHSIMDNCQLSINNNKITLQASECVAELMRTHSSARDFEHRSTAPMYPDQSQQYADMVNTNRNPLAAYGETPDTPSRGAFPMTIVANPLANGANVMEAVIEANLTETLLISPLLFGGDERKGLSRVQNLSLTINWTSLDRIWSYVAPAGWTFSSIAVELLQPSLSFKYITLPPSLSVPDVLEYEFDNVEVHVNELGAQQNAGATYSMTSSNLQLNAVPEYLMIYAKKRRGDRTAADADAWQSIQSLDLSWANGSGLFSGASKQDLYDISLRNGVDMSYPEWAGEAMYNVVGGAESYRTGVGSLLLLKFARDIAMADPAVSVGTAGTYNLQVRVGLKNTSAAALFPALYIVPIYKGVFTIAQNQSIQQLAVLSQMDVVQAAQQAESQGAIAASDFEGGGKFNFMRAAHDALPYIRKGRAIAQKVAAAVPTPQGQAVKAALDVAEAVGLGKGGLMVGGQKISRAELRKALMQ